MNETPSNNGAFIAKLGAWLQVSPVLGIIGMVEAFFVLRTSGAGDPEKLSAAIGNVLTYTTIAVSLALIGLVLVTIAITACRYRSRWMFQFLCFYGLLIIGLNICLVILGHFMFSFYLPFGMLFLIFALVKKQEFIQAAEVRRKLPSCYKLDS